MPIVLRSVDVVLQNSTNELLTMEGFTIIRGDWGPPGPPRRGDVIEKQSSAKWLSQSTTDGIGAQGFLRLGSTKGYIEVAWNLPWVNVAHFEHQITVPPRLDHRVRFNKENLDWVVMMVTLVPRGA